MTKKGPKTPEGKRINPEQKKDKSLVDEVINYLKNTTIASIKLNDERDLERYMFGKLEEFFRGKKAKINPQRAGIKGGIPDIIIERGKETAVVELKYVRDHSQYKDAIGQALEYAKDRSSKVILFCFDPDRKIKGIIPVKGVITLVKPYRRELG